MKNMEPDKTGVQVAIQHRLPSSDFDVEIRAYRLTSAQVKTPDSLSYGFAVSDRFSRAVPGDAEATPLTSATEAG
jgi:hypothetical protein